MFIQLKNQVFKLIGDPHLGKEFKNGVPIARRGERERKQFELFKKELNDIHTPTGARVTAVIIMGDIFDRFFVPDHIKSEVSDMIEFHAANYPDVDYVVIRGNHDCSRDIMEESSFNILQRMLSKLPNVIFVSENYLYNKGKLCPWLMFCGYNEFTPTSEIDYGTNVLDAVFGHWDMQAIGGADHNLIPLAKLVKITSMIYNGHVHTPSITNLMDEAQVICVGSMMPYSHGEDPTEQIYITRTMEDYLAETLLQGASYHDKVLRLKLKRGEEVPEGLANECLQFSIQYIDEDEKEETEVKMEEFSFEALFKGVLSEVSEETAEYWWKKYREKVGHDLNA